MSKVNPSYTKTDTGQIPRYQAFASSLEIKDPELKRAFMLLEREIARKFLELETRINVLQGETGDIEFDKTTDTTLTLNVTRGVIQSHTVV